VLLGVGAAALGVFVDRLEERRSNCSTVMSVTEDRAYRTLPRRDRDRHAPPRWIRRNRISRVTS